MKPVVSMLCCMFVPALVICQNARTDVGGYLEYLLSTTYDSPQGNTVDQLIHARLNTKWYPTDAITGVMELRFRGYYGGTVEHTPLFADQIKNRSGYGHLDATVWSSTQSLGYAEVDRLYANWAVNNVQATVGRQRIAWGTNLVWNVIDIFNPLSVLDFDYVERPGVDAAQVQYYTGPVSKVALAYKPETEFSKSITGFLWSLNHWDYDFHIVGGDRYGLPYGGMGWAGDIAGGGFRGEALLSDKPAILTGAATSSKMFSGALSGDYTFQNSFYIHTEVLYNSQGTSSNAAAFLPISQKLGLLSPARWSVFQEFSYDLSPLVRGSAFALFNPDDRSVAFVPSITWSAATNLDLMFLGLIFSGKEGAEYGGQGKGFYLRGKWSF
ncbi:MAG TPA: hypothetical protein VMM58_11695 [Bacteroidota bacterium]|nr:hypothetical protein [Bacteroidota bacterium]